MVVAMFLAAFIWSVGQEMIYESIPPDFICIVPGTENYQKNLTWEEYMKLTAPSSEQGTLKQCHYVMREYDNMTFNEIQDILNGTNSNQTKADVKCQQWQYDLTVYGESIVSQVRTNISLYQ